MFRVTKKDITAESYCLKIFASQTLSLMGLMGPEFETFVTFEIRPMGLKTLQNCTNIAHKCSDFPGPGAQGTICKVTRRAGSLARSSSRRVYSGQGKMRHVWADAFLFF